MNRMPLADRRAQLVDAALRVAAQSGVEAVTIRAVAHEAGVSLGTVHYCFHDKDELLDVMGQSISVEVSDQLRGAITAGAEAGLDFPALLRGCAPALLASLKRYRQVRLLLLEIATTGARNATMRPTALNHLEQSTQMAQDLMLAVADAAGVRYAVDVGTVARITTALIDGVELAWLVDEDDERALECFGALADLLVGYVEPPSTAST